MKYETCFNRSNSKVEIEQKSNFSVIGVSCIFMGSMFLFGIFILLIQSATSYKSVDGDFLGLMGFFSAIVLIIGIALQVTNNKKIRNKLNEESVPIANKNKELAGKVGLEKYVYMVDDEAERKINFASNLRQNGDSLSKLWMPLETAEKETSWGLIGGIAEGIAGPAAGAAAAMKTIEENQRIRERNAGLLERNIKTLESRERLKNYFNTVAENIEKNPPKNITLEQAEKDYYADMTISPEVLFDNIEFRDTRITINKYTKSVRVNTEAIFHNDSKIANGYIDGSIMAKIYTISGVCVGNVYLILPKDGILRSCSAKIGGVGFAGKYSSSYYIKFVPVNLWLRKKLNIEKEGKITEETHNIIVDNLRKAYEGELIKNS